MRRFDRANTIVVLAVGLVGLTCALPTDKSDDVFVVVATDGGKAVILQGQKLGVHATLWQRTGTDSVEIQNTAFQWSTTANSCSTPVRA